MSPMISVIIPVYKVEEYIKKCVQSIIHQTYKDFELILVNDGSPDNCPYICDCYAHDYNFIKVVHKKNGGLSDARNAGINVARGKYVTFIDGDDYVKDNYLELLYNTLLKHCADISAVRIQKFYSDEMRNNIKENLSSISLSGLQALEYMFYQKMIDTSSCALLLPLEIAKNNPFPVGKFHEDEFTTYKYYATVKSVAISMQSAYFYRQRRDSIMHMLGQANIDELDAADNLVEECKIKWPKLVPAANSKKFSDYCQVLMNIKNIKEEKIVYKRLLIFLKKIKWQILFDRKTRLKNKFAAGILICDPNLLIFLNRIIKKYYGNIFV